MLPWGKTDRDRHAGDQGIESKGGSIDATMALTKDQLTIDERLGAPSWAHEDEDDPLVGVAMRRAKKQETLVDDSPTPSSAVCNLQRCVLFFAVNGTDGF